MAEPTDEPTRDQQQAYFEYVVTHMLHRIWELQATSLLLSAKTDEDRQAVQSLIDKQREQDYITPLDW